MPDPERDIEQRLRGVAERLRQYAEWIYDEGMLGATNALRELADEIEACLSAPVDDREQGEARGGRQLCAVCKQYGPPTINKPCPNCGNPPAPADREGEQDG